MASKQRKVFTSLLPMALLCLCCVFSGCSHSPRQHTESLREQLNADTDQALSAFLLEDLSLRQQLDAAPGYLIGTGDSIMVGPLGKSNAKAVLVDQRDNSKTYLDIDSVGLGLGLGSRDSRTLAIIKSPRLLDELKKGRWFLNPQLDSSVGDQGGGTRFHSEDYDIYIRGESGASVSAGINLARVKVNNRLTDTGLSGSSLPGRGQTLANQTEAAPRHWPYPLPLFGQAVIDRGINLPRPFGAGAIYAQLDQTMELTNLELGFNGGEKTPYEFVSFANAESSVHTTQFKLDMWLLPFMNIYATAGQVEGDVTLDVNLDGNTLLSGLSKDCSGILRPPSCLLLQDRELTIPVRLGVRPTTYGAGTVLAGAWHDWFMVVPVNISYSKSDTLNFEGNTLSASPRLGYMFTTAHTGSVALFVGASYLDSENKVDGEFVIPGTTELLSFRLTQRNTDAWTALAGFNWDISARLSLMAEYDGMSGSREGFITALVMRF